MDHICVEADILNVVLFKCLAKDWRIANPEHAQQELNIRDFASINELVVLSNLENINAIMIEKEMSKGERLSELQRIAEKQLATLNKVDLIKSLKKDSETTFVDAQKKLKDNNK